VPLPSAVQYGNVAWRAISAVADGGDLDAQPDVIPVTGTVTFTASIPLLAVGGASDPVTVFLTPVTYQLDGAGVLRDIQRRPLLTLVATDTVPGVTWKWTATYKLNGGLARGAIEFALPAGSTVDLTNPTVPVPGGPTAGVDNGNGTATLSGADVTDNGDGTFTMSSLADNGDGTFTVA
jgi:hypothetical protein